MADTDRAQWITILEAASVSPPDELNAEWEWLMKELGLPLDWWLAVTAAGKLMRNIYGAFNQFDT